MYVRPLPAVALVRAAAYAGYALGLAGFVFAWHDEPWRRFSRKGVVTALLSFAEKVCAEWTGYGMMAICEAASGLRTRYINQDLSRCHFKALDICICHVPSQSIPSTHYYTSDITCADIYLASSKGCSSALAPRSIDSVARTECYISISIALVAA